MRIATLRLCGVLVLLALAAPVRGGGDDKWWIRWFGDPANDPQQVADDEKLLRDAKLGTDTKDLLEYLKSMTPAKDDEAKIKELFQLLDSPKFTIREKAQVDLIAVGPKAIPIIKQQLPGAILEVRMRAEKCLKILEDKSPAMLSAACVRLLRARKLDNVVGAILEFAPYAPDESVAEEILDAVYALGYRKGKLDPALDAALKDEQRSRRAIAAVLLGRFGNDDQRKAAAALLDDKDAEVRFRAAQGLLARGDRDTLPILVESLKSAPYHLAERAEEILLRAAGDTAPKQSLESSEAARGKCHEAWKGWLAKHGANVDLTKADLGLPLASPELRAREVVRQFMDMAAFTKPDKAKLARITEVPFYQAGQRIFNTRQEFEDALAQEQPAPEGLKFKMTIKKTYYLKDYMPKADPKEKEFLQKYSAAEVRVVDLHMDLDFMGQNIKMTLPIFVRVSGARGRIFGFGMPQDVGALKN
jgi:HEAT repeat protein